MYKSVGDKSEDIQKVTAEFIQDYWYEVCEPCMRNTIVPSLKSLRRITFPESTEQQEEEEPALRAEPAEPFRPHGISRGPLIGEEDMGQPTQSPPLSDDEPF